MTEPDRPKLVFSHDDLSFYERIRPQEFDDFDEVDSLTVDDPGAPPDDAA